MATTDAIKFGASGGAAVSKLSLRAFLKVITNKRGFGFFVIALNFLKSILSQFHNAWAEKSLWPIVQEAGLRILANDRTMIEGVERIKAFQGVEVSKFTILSAYYDTYMGLFTFSVLFLVIFFFFRQTSGPGDSVLVPFCYTWIAMFLVELVVIQALIIKGVIPDETFVFPLKGIYTVIANYSIVLPGI
jgi:hypothetical protein